MFLGSGFNLSILEGTIGCIPMKSFSLSLQGNFSRGVVKEPVMDKPNP